MKMQLSAESMTRHWFLVSLVLLLGSGLPVHGQGNPSTDSPTTPPCETTGALSDCPTCTLAAASGWGGGGVSARPGTGGVGDDFSPVSARPGSLGAGNSDFRGVSAQNPGCGNGGCSGGNPNTPGALFARLQSIHVGIVCGRAPHEPTNMGKIFLTADQPSEELFSPSALTYSHVLGGAIVSVTTDGLADGVEREVTLMDLDGVLDTFRFPDGQSVGQPLDSEACSTLDLRLRKLGSDGSPTTGQPAYYDFYMVGQQKSIRYSADTRQAVGYDNGDGRYIDATATKLEVIKDAAGVLRQIRTATELADIVVPQDGITANGTIWKYTISFYADSDVGEKDEDDRYYLLQQGATAYTAITIENPAPAEGENGNEKDTNFDTLKLTRTVGGTDYVYEYSYTDASKQWQLGRGAGLPYETLRSSYDDTNLIETRTRELRESDGTLVASTVETWAHFDWGTKKVMESVRTDAEDETALLTTRYLYYASGTVGVPNDPRQEYIVATYATAKQGRVHSVRYPTGAWEITDYDGQGRPTLVVRPWKDQTVDWNTVSESTIATAAANGNATYYSYTGVDTNESPASDDRRPRTITREIAGVAVGKAYYAYYENTSGEKISTAERASTPAAGYGATGNLRRTRTYYASNATAASAGRLKTIQSPDGRLATYIYEAGTYASNATPSLCSFAAGTGDTFRTIITHGTVSSPNGVANRTTRNAEVRDAYGNEVLSETYVYNGTGYERIDWTVRTYDTRWRPVNVYFSNGTSTSAQWGCCGKDSETLADGTEWSYGYDSLLRLDTRTKECGTTDIVTSYTYNAAGRQHSETTTTGTLSLSTATGYDLGGRVVRRISREGLLTTTVYTDGGRTVATTHPGGGTEVSTTYLDGRAKASAGTSVTDTYYDYGIDTTTVTGQTLTTATTYQGLVPNGGTFADIALWSRVYANPLGLKVRTEKPAFGHTVGNPVLAVSTRSYDTVGRLAIESSPRRADMLHEYDTALGELLRSGLDLNGDGNLDLATDPIAEASTVYEKDASNDWWRVTDSRVYSVEDDDPGTAGTDERTLPVTLGTQRVRLTGLGGTSTNLGILVAEERSTDVDANERVRRAYIDSSAKQVMHLVDSPFSSTESSAVVVNGLKGRSTSLSGLTTHYLYDGLGRQTGVTDPRISSYDEQTGTWSNYNQTHYNAVGQTDWTKDTAGNQTSYGYDNPPANPTDTQRQAATGRQISVTNAMDKVKRMAHTDRGQLNRIWGDTDYPVEYGYDELGRRTSLKTYRGGTGWDGTTWPSEATGTADTTTWNYEAATGLLESKEYADGKGPSYAYYSDGSLETRAWARNALTTTYGYDPNTGQLTSVDCSDATPDVSYTYTRAGKIRTVSDATGTRAFAYAGRDKLDSEKLSASFYGATTILTRSYDALGRDEGYGLSWNGSTAQAATYGYDTSGRFFSVASNGGTFTYGYLADSDLVTTLSGPASILQTRVYETTRDPVDYVENKVGATTVSKYNYSNDTIGRRTSVQKTGTAFGQADTVTWGYDDRSQVASGVAANDANYDYTYAYDPIGNRTNYVTKETGTAVSTTYGRNQLNQYTAITGRTDPTYDDDGNIALLPSSGGNWSLTWSGENRLAAMESSSARLEFAYDYLGRRVQKRTYTGTVGNWTLAEDRRFLYDGWNLIAEFTADGETVGLERTHLWGLDLSRSLQGAGGVGGLLRTSEHGAAVMAYYPTYDANGNVSEYVYSSGTVVAHYEYSPFGTTTAATGTKATAMPFRFSTKYLDGAADLYYYGYRSYIPAIGRWASRDPIGEDGGANLLGFAVNRPTERWDHLGNMDYADGGTGVTLECCGNEGLKYDPGTECCLTRGGGTTVLPGGLGVVITPPEFYVLAKFDGECCGNSLSDIPAAAMACNLAVGANVILQMERNGIEHDTGPSNYKGGNAFRHCVAACQAKKGCGCASAFWTFREGTPGSVDDRQDLANNSVGFSLAEGGSCWDACKEAWRDGKLTCKQRPEGGLGQCPPP